MSDSIRPSRITISTATSLAGLGLAVVSLILPYAIKTMPEAVWLPVLVIGALMAIVPVILWARRGTRDQSAESLSTEPESPPQTGSAAVVLRGPGIEGNVIEVGEATGFDRVFDVSGGAKNNKLRARVVRRWNHS